jgi:hypothetical protein
MKIPVTLLTGVSNDLQVLKLKALKAGNYETHMYLNTQTHYYNNQ